MKGNILTSKCSAGTRKEQQWRKLWKRRQWIKSCKLKDKSSAINGRTGKSIYIQRIIKSQKKYIRSTPTRKGSHFGPFTHFWRYGIPAIEKTLSNFYTLSKKKKKSKKQGDTNLPVLKPWTALSIAPIPVPAYLNKNSRKS